MPHHVTAGTYHDDAMLTVVRSGVGHYYYDGRDQRIDGGFVGLVLPCADPGLLMADLDDPYDHFYCRFAGMEALRMARGIVADRGGARFFRWSRWPEAASILESMLALEKLAPNSELEWMSQTEGELARLLSLLIVPLRKSEPLLNEHTLLRYLSDHISEPLDLDGAARHFSLSRYHFSRQAHELLGEPLGAASQRTKLEFARALLEATSVELSISDIAQRLGYADALYFSRVFRRHSGLSPRQYRTKHRHIIRK